MIRTASTPMYYIFPHTNHPTALCPAISIQPMHRPRALAFRVAPYLVDQLGWPIRALHCQVEVTAEVGKSTPAAFGTTRRLEAKYKVFLEAIDMQRRWRMMMEEACQNI